MEIRKAAVLGSGVMGAAIAANLAGAGVEVILLDLPGLSEKGLRWAMETSPPAFYSRKDAELIRTGSFEGDMHLISGADWIVEAVVENLEIKKDLLRRVLEFWQEGTIVTTNTSGLSVNSMIEELPINFRRHFFGTHFFNPPRYMKLLEIVPSTDTRDEVLDIVVDFAEKRLGKGAVYCKDTPNFIANRIGVFSFMHALRLMMDMQLSVEEVDGLTGSAIGRPNSATFRTADLVGIDVIVHVARNSHENLTNDPRRDVFKPPEILEELVEKGWIGQKVGQGFYKKEGDEILSLDVRTMDYKPRKKVSFASLDMMSAIEDLGERLTRLLGANDKAGEFLWQHISQVLLYAALTAPEISDDVVSVDRAMKWGFNWEMGPFETWDSIGVRDTLERIEKEGKEIPELVRGLLHRGGERFYRREDGERSCFNHSTGSYEKIQLKPQMIVLPSAEERRKVVLSNPGATLVDLDDGIACLEFHTKMNVIGPDIVILLTKSLGETEENFDGLVIGNQGKHFSAGANIMLILLEAQEGNWEELEFMVSQFQQACMAIKLSKKPVVAAPFGMTLGGGMEICLHSHRVRAATESYMGLVETGVGVIPAGGGTKEMVMRSQEGIPGGKDIDLFPFVRRAFENIGMARVSSSAKEARELGYMRREDGITFNKDFLLGDAKNTAKALLLDGFSALREEKDIRVLGRDGYAAIKAGLYNMARGGYITEYEEKLGSKLAYVMTGGDVLPGSLVSEQHLLDLEREAFLSLCGEAKTQERMQHMLRTRKPLRN